MSTSLRSPVGPNHIEWGALHFIAPEPGDRAANLDEHDENALVNRYCLGATLQIGSQEFQILPSVVGLCRELMSGMKAISRGDTAMIYLVEDREFYVQFEPARLGSEIYQLQLSGPADVLSFWHESVDRILFEFSAILQALTQCCSQADVPIEELLKRCRGEVGWSCSE
jgi:hypothetical protein